MREMFAVPDLEFRAIATEPEPAVACFTGAAHITHGKTLIRAVCGELASGESGEAICGADPQIPVAPWNQAMDARRGEAVAHRVLRHGAVVKPHQAGIIRADPEVVLFIFEQGSYPVVLKRDLVCAFRRREAHSIEPHQAALRSKPEVTIVSLQNGENRRLREPLLHLLNAMDVLSQRPAWIETPCLPAYQRRKHEKR